MHDDVDRHTSTVEGAAGHAARLAENDPHSSTCRCHACCVDLADDPWDPA